MAKTIKKKINVPLLIVLLIFSVVPGILYLIYCSIPTRIPDKAPKNNGKALRLIGSALAFLSYIVAMIFFGMEEGLLAAILGLGAGTTGFVLLVTLCSLKAKNAGVFTFIGILNILSLLVAVLYFVFLLSYFLFWLALPVLVGIILTFVGLSNGKKQVLFDRYANVDVDADDAVL